MLAQVLAALIAAQEDGSYDFTVAAATSGPHVVDAGGLAYKISGNFLGSGIGVDRAWLSEHGLRFAVGGLAAAGYWFPQAGSFTSYAEPFVAELKASFGYALNAGPLSAYTATVIGVSYFLVEADPGRGSGRIVLDSVDPYRLGQLVGVSVRTWQFLNLGATARIDLDGRWTAQLTCGISVRDGHAAAQ